MNLIEKMKLKTEQAMMKTDRFVREHGAITGLAFGAAAIMAGIAGVAAMTTVAAATAPVAAPIAAAAALAAAPGLSFMGIPLTMAGTAMLWGGTAGIGFAGLSKLYSEKVKSKDAWYDDLSGSYYMNCVDKNGSTVSVPAMKFFEMVEKDTLKDSFVSVENKNSQYFKETISTIGLDLHTAALIQGDGDTEKVRRLLFRDTQDMSFAKSLKNRIMGIREDSLGNNTSSLKLS